MSPDLVGGILDLGVPGLLLIAVIVIWREWKIAIKDCTALREQLYEDAKENAVIARALIAAQSRSGNNS